MGAEFRLVRSDGGPLDLADEELKRYSMLGLAIFFERAEASLPRAIRIEATEGFEDAGRDCASRLADELELTAIDLTAGSPLVPGAQAPWWAYWRGR
jgi:hypothetical protein